MGSADGQTVQRATCKHAELYILAEHSGQEDSEDRAPRPDTWELLKNNGKEVSKADVAKRSFG